LVVPEDRPSVPERCKIDNGVALHAAGHAPTRGFERLSGLALPESSLRVRTPGLTRVDPGCRLSLVARKGTSVYPSRLTFAAAVVAALVAASVAEAGSSFKGNVCSVVPPKKVAAISGVSSKCVNAKPSRGPGSMIYVANWAGKTPTSPRMQVTIALYGDAGLLQLAKRNLNQGLPGTPKKVSGIGSAAYEGVGASSTAIHFSVGKHIAYVSVTAVGKPSRSAASLEALAKGIAARL
jgi:hypothetical protein